MHKPHYKFVLTLLLVLWTAGVLYGSLAPGDDLPPAGWLAMIPYFDKVVHFGFYFWDFVANSSGALVAVAVAPLLQRFVKRSLR